MKLKRSLSLILTLCMILGSLASLSTLSILSVGATDPLPHPYVADGLVSLYDGANHGASDSVWEDTVGDNDLPVNVNDKNHFTDTGLAVEGAKHSFPQAIVDVVNGQEFTVELLFSEFTSIGADFNTFLNSSNDNFALFRRNSTDQLEFKFAANPGDQRHKIDDGLNLLQNALITVTYKVGGTCYIYVNGQLMAEKPSPSAMGANDLFIGQTANKDYSTTYRSMRFYNRQLSDSEVMKNSIADGVASVADKYVQDGLVSLYSAFDADITATEWIDRVGENHVPVTVDENNHFVEGGYLHAGAQNYFPKGIVDVINGNEFTVELHISDLVPAAPAYCTMLNSSNDHFALFRRNSNDVLEFKFAANAAGSRNMIEGCEELLQDALITVTYNVSGESRIYINGVLQSSMPSCGPMGADDFFFGHAEGNRYFDALYRDMRFYNRELTAAEVKINARADGYDVPSTDQPVVETPGYVTVAQPVTNIIGDISFIREINSEAELNTMMKGEALPAVALYKIDADLNVLGDKGNAITTVSKVLEKTEFKVLSAFCVDSMAAADALTAYLKDLSFYDCFIVASDPAILKAARTAAPSVSGVIDFRDTYKDATALTEEQCLEIRRTLKVNNGHIALLPEAVCSNATVQYLYVRQVNVWAGCTGSATDTDLYSAILSGAVGVMSDKTDTMLDIATNKLPVHTMTRVTTNTGHRGIPAKAPENTLEGSLLAFELGANVIELDIYITTDGHVVVMHDGTTGRTFNQNLTVEASTLAQLRELKVITSDPKFADCKVPTLEEYLEAFKDKDCNLFIEIKSTKREIIPAMKALIDKHDMYDQCTVITFHESILRYMREDYPEMHGGFLCGDIMAGANAEAGLRGAMNTVGRINASINPSSGGYDEADLRAALRRGISVYPWTFRGDVNVYKPYFMWGYSGLTGDNADVLGKYAKAVEYTGKTAYAVGESLPLALNMTDYLRLTEAKKATLTILDGEEYVNVTDDALEFKADGEVTILLAFYQRMDRQNDYYLHTQPITITIGNGIPDETESETQPTESETEPTVTETDPVESVTEPAESDTVPADSETGAATDPTDNGTDAETDAPKTDKGCASVMGISALLLLASGAAVILRRRHED